MFLGNPPGNPPRNFWILSNPEFLAEGTAMKDRSKLSAHSLAISINNIYIYYIDNIIIYNINIYIYTHFYTIYYIYYILLCIICHVFYIYILLCIICYKFNFTSNCICFGFWNSLGDMLLPLPGVTRGCHKQNFVRPKDLDAPDRVLIGGQDQEPDGTGCITYTADLSISRGIGLKSCQWGSLKSDDEVSLAPVESILVTLLVSSHEWAY